MFGIAGLPQLFSVADVGSAKALGGHPPAYQQVIKIRYTAGWITS